MKIEKNMIKYLSEKEINYMFARKERIEYGYIQKSTNKKAHCITANICKGVPYNVLFEKVFELNNE